MLRRAVRRSPRTVAGGAVGVGVAVAVGKGVKVTVGVGDGVGDGVMVGGTGVTSGVAFPQPAVKIKTASAAINST